MSDNHAVTDLHDEDLSDLISEVDKEICGLLSRLPGLLGAMRVIRDGADSLNPEQLRDARQAAESIGSEIARLTEGPMGDWLRLLDIAAEVVL